MKNCAFIGNEKQIRNVFGVENTEKMAKLGMDTGLILTRELLEKEPLAAKNTEYLFSTWGMPHFEKEEIKKYFPSLKAIFYAAGTVQAFAKEFIDCGVNVFSAWAANAVPVAEYTVAQILLANKGFYGSSRIYKSTKDKKQANLYSNTFTGNFNVKVGIIGAGMIGKLVINLLRPYNINILVFDPFLPQEKADELGVAKCDLETLFKECNTISNHLANNPQTVGMINYGVISLMKPNATFINTGRGAQVVEDDLIRALKEEPDRNAVLDVTWPEPPESDSELFTLENIILTPHIAGSFGNEVVRMANYMLEEYDAFKAGKPTRYNVTAEMLKTMA